MLSQKQVDFFRVFGYLAIRGLLQQEQLKRLQEAFDSEIENNPRVTAFKENGSRNFMPNSDDDPIFTELICHTGLMEAMRDLDGTEFIFSTGSMNSTVGDVDWHADYNPPHFESRPVKAMYYLDEMRAQDGAFYLIPGTNDPNYASTIVRRFGYYTETGGCRMDLDSHEVPSVCIETSPGDVVLWQNRMWHYASKRKNGKPRRLLQNQYFMDPKGDPVEEKWMKDFFSGRVRSEGWGNGKYIYNRRMLDSCGTALHNMGSRLEALGVADAMEPSD